MKYERLKSDMSRPTVNRATGIYLIVFSGASVVSAAIAWIYSSYFKNDFAALLVFHGQDGNCDTVTQGIGVHCFGDYSAIHYTNLFQVPQGAEVVYPLITRIFRLPFLWIEMMSSYRIGLVCYLATLIFAMIYPVLHSYFKGPEKFPFLIWLFIACINVGMLSTLDRGNVIAFAIPFLYLFFVRFLDGNSKRASVYLLLAIMVKPQFALFAIAFLWRREIKTFLMFFLQSLLVITAPYLVFGTKSISVLGDWIRESMRWSKSLPPTAGFPTNYSFNRVLSLVDSNNIRFSYVVGLLFLLALTAPLLIKKRKIERVDLLNLSLVVLCMNSIVYVYYSVLLIPICVILFAQPEENPELTNRQRFGTRFVPILLALATAPLAWPSRWKIGDVVSASGSYNMVPLIITLGVVGYTGGIIVSNFLSLSHHYKQSGK